MKIGATCRLRVGPCQVCGQLFTAPGRGRAPLGCSPACRKVHRREMDRLASHRYYTTHREEVLARLHAHDEARQEERRAYGRAYYWNNRDKALAYARRRYQERRAEENGETNHAAQSSAAQSSEINETHPIPGVQH